MNERKTDDVFGHFLNEVALKIELLELRTLAKLPRKLDKLTSDHVDAF